MRLKVLQRCIHKTGLSSKDLAGAVGMSEARFNDLLKLDEVDINLDNLLKIVLVLAEILDEDKEQLLRMVLQEDFKVLDEAYYANL